MDKIYLLNILGWHENEITLVSIYSSYKAAENAKKKFEENWKKIGIYDIPDYEIFPVDLNESLDCLYDSVLREDDIFNE